MTTLALAAVALAAVILCAWSWRQARAARRDLAALTATLAAAATLPERERLLPGTASGAPLFDALVRRYRAQAMAER